MGISKLTAIIIQTNKVNVDIFKDKNTEKYGFIISRMERENYRMLLDTQAVYDTETQAQTEGDGLVKTIKEMDLAISS